MFAPESFPPMDRCTHCPLPPRESGAVVRRLTLSASPITAGGQASEARCTPNDETRDDEGTDELATRLDEMVHGRTCGFRALMYRHFGHGRLTARFAPARGVARKRWPDSVLVMCGVQITQESILGRYDWRHGHRPAPLGACEDPPANRHGLIAVRRRV